MGEEDDTADPRYRLHVLLGVSFVLLTSLSGPLVAYVWHPAWNWRFGFLFSGVTEWVYVLPTLALAKRAGKLGFRNGVLGAALAFLFVDVIAFVILAFLVRSLSGLH